QKSAQAARRDDPTVAEGMCVLGAVILPESPQLIEIARMVNQRIDRRRNPNQYEEPDCDCDRETPRRQALSSPMMAHKRDDQGCPSDTHHEGHVSNVRLRHGPSREHNDRQSPPIDACERPCRNQERRRRQHRHEWRPTAPSSLTEMPKEEYEDNSNPQ